MDGDRFDQLTRSLARPLSRRSALARAAGALLAGSALGAMPRVGSANTAVTGDLAYCVKNGGYWDIWAYSFDTQQNTQLTNEAYSDQWAPSYSHDGSRLAYISDQIDGTNQIWLMAPDGSGKQPITNWYGSEKIIYVAWSPDDTYLIVTLFGDSRRLVLLPVAGGGFIDYIGVSSSFAATSRNGRLAYVSDYGTSDTTVHLGAFDAPPGQPFAPGDTPNLTQNGAYVAVQLGDPGSRHIVTYPVDAQTPALPDMPWVGDDSHPVWISSDASALAFVSAGASGEMIRIAQPGSTEATFLPIAAHERVWYLSKRFVAGAIAPPANPTPTIPAAGSSTYTSAHYGFRVDWTGAWTKQDQLSGLQTNGSDRLVLWHTGEVVAATDLRAGAGVPINLDVCVSEAIDTFATAPQFQNNAVPNGAAALTPAPGAVGRTVQFAREGAPIVAYVECRALSSGAGSLRIVYQVTGDGYAAIYPDIVELLGMIQA